MYVALSSVTSIDNLFLIGKYNHNVFKVNKSAIRVSIQLRETNLVESIQIMLIVIVLQCHC